MKQLMEAGGDDLVHLNGIDSSGPPDIIPRFNLVLTAGNRNGTVPTYSGGTAADSHRFPYYPLDGAPEKDYFPSLYN